MSTSMREKKLAFTKGVIAEMQQLLAAVTNRREADELRATFEATLAFNSKMVKGMALEPEVWNEVAAELEQLRAEIQRKSPTPAAPVVAWRAGFLCPASVSNFETADDITDWELLKLFDGVEPQSLFSIELFNDHTGIEVLDVNGALRARDGKLAFAVIVGLHREPTAREIQKIAEALDRMLDSNWGRNIDWLTPEDDRLDELMPHAGRGFVLDPASMSPATFRN